MSYSKTTPKICVICGNAIRWWQRKIALLPFPWVRYHRYCYNTPEAVLKVVRKSLEERDRKEYYGKTSIITN